MGKPRKKRRGHGPRGKSVDFSVHEGVARQLDETRAELNDTLERLHTIEKMLVSVVNAAGGILDVDFAPAGLGLDSEDRDGGMVLYVIGKAVQEGQGGEDARETDPIQRADAPGDSQRTEDADAAGGEAAALSRDGSP